MSAEKYLKAALDGVCEELHLTPPGCNQAGAIYAAAFRLARLVVEYNLENHWLDTVEYELVQSGLQMQNQPGRERWTEATIRKQVMNGVRDAKAKRDQGSPPDGLKKAVQAVSAGSVPELPIQPNELRRHCYEVDSGPVLIKVRYDGEPKFRPFFRDIRADGSAFWNPHKPEGFQYVPYGLELLKASQGKTVYITEGERCADSLRDLGLCATTFGSAGFWPSGAEMHFAGRDVVVIGDNDEAGQRHIDAITGKLAGVARSVKSWIPTGGPPGYDVADWICDHPGADIRKAISEEQEPRSISNVVAIVTGSYAEVQTEPVIVRYEPPPLKPVSRFRPHLIVTGRVIEALR